MVDYFILCIFFDEEREVFSCCYENVSCLFCGEERKNAGNYFFFFSDIYDLYKVVIIWFVGEEKC